MTCKTNQDRCIKATLEGDGKHVVAKSCETAADCSKGAVFCDTLRKKYGVTECDVTCCSGDNCNHSSKNSQIMFGVIVFGVLTAITLH